MSAIQLFDLNGEQRFTGTAVGAIRQAAITLTNAQIIALPSTGVEIVAAPGLGFAILPVYGVMVAHFAAGGYTGGANDYFTIGTGTDAAEEMGATRIAMVDGTIPPLLPTISDTAALGYTPVQNQAASQLENAALTISASAAGNLGGGGAGNTLTVMILYVIVAV